MTPSDESISREAQELLEILNRCATSCETCQELATRESASALAICAQLAGDCAETCRLAMRLVNTQNRSIQKFLIVCSNICRDCAAECAKFQLSYTLECSTVCLECADACHHQ